MGSGKKKTAQQDRLLQQKGRRVRGKHSGGNVHGANQLAGLMPRLSMKFDLAIFNVYANPPICPTILCREIVALSWIEPVHPPCLLMQLQA